MLIGNKQSFAIECYHDDMIPNDNRWVFGHMCLWLAGNCCGDIEESEMLNVTEGCLQWLLQSLDSLDDPALRGLDDRAAFDFLGDVVYGGIAGKSIEQIAANAARFYKFNFLSNGGESFDCSRSFIIGDGDSLRILFEKYQRGIDGAATCFISARVDRASFITVVRGFLAWMEAEKERVPPCSQ